MKYKISALCFLFVAGSAFLANTSFAGTGKVKFGAYTAGQGCSGTGLCQSGSGANVSFSYYENADTAGGTVRRVSMLVNYDQAVANGFIGESSGGTYRFMGGYTFDHAGDQNMGVPSSFSIPADFVAPYSTIDYNGRITITVSLYSKN